MILWNRMMSVALTLMGLSSFFMGCQTSIRWQDCRYEIDVPEEYRTRVDRKRIESSLARYLVGSSNDVKYTAFITIYRYSSGKEIYRLSESSSEEIGVESQKGYAEAMVKIRDGKHTVKIIFARGSGKSRDEIVENLVRDILARLGREFP